jgi:hypothetical protein
MNPSVWTSRGSGGPGGSFGATALTAGEAIGESSQMAHRRPQDSF